MCEEMYKTSVLCVDSYDNGVLAGRIVNPYLGADIPFRSAIEFVKGTETLMQELQYPQKFSDNRRFTPVEMPTPLPAGKNQNTAKKGLLATFALKIMFRQNASWQGSLLWVEQKQEQRFRSVLELLLMIDSVVAAA